MNIKSSSEKEIDVIELIKDIWFKRLSIIKWGAIGVVVGVVVALSIPKSYNVTVKIAPESIGHKNSSQSLGGLASMMGIGGISGQSGINEVVYPDILKSSPFLAEFSQIKVPFDGGDIDLREYLLDNQKSAWWSKIIALPMKVVGATIGLIKGVDSEEDRGEKEIDRFRPTKDELDFERRLAESIEISKDKTTNVSSLVVSMQSGEIAAIVADSIMTKLQRYVTLYHTSKTRHELLQCEKMLEEVKKEYYDADNRYAEALDRNQNLISQRAKAQIERLANERNLTFDIYQQAAMQVEVTRMKLNEETPIATVIEPARVPILAASPRKALIVLGFGFLFAFSVVVAVAFRSLTDNDYNS